MFKNYLLIALRNILNQKFFSALNILGLAAGMATFLFIYVYVHSEKFYDRDWENAESIYRISQHVNFGSGTDFFAMSSYPLANALNNNFPDVQHAVRTTQYFRRPVKVDTTIFEVERMLFADKDFFSVFNYHFTEGTADSALTNENSVAIADELAREMFPNESALGKSIRFFDDEFVIRAVYNTYRKKSHLRPQLIASLEHVYKKKTKEWDSAWMRIWLYTYMELKSPERFPRFYKQFTAWQDTTMQQWRQQSELSYHISFLPQAINELHFDKVHTYSISQSAESYYVQFLSWVAFLVLVVASVNFVNLGTARSIKRAKEVGVRKVAGASRRQLIVQFIAESIIITALASVIALVLVEFNLPFLNAYLGTDLSLFYFLVHENNGEFFIMLFLLVVGVGVFSGFFPAFILSSFDPVLVLKIGGLSSRRLFRRNTVSVQVRKVLVITQFAIATGLLIMTLVIYQQIYYVKNVDMGFDKKQVLVLDLPSGKDIPRERADSLLNLLQRIPEISTIEKGHGLPGYKHGRISFDIKQGDTIQQIPINFNFVGSDYMDLLHLELVQGRFFHPDSSADEKNSFVVNEAALELLGNNPLGARMNCDLGIDGKVVGVLKNYHYHSLKGHIQPLVLVYSPKKRYRFALKLSGARTDVALAKINSAWAMVFPEYIMRYDFLEEKFNDFYHEEDRLFSLFVFVALMAVFIALLGLFGLSTFVIEQQAKTIGIKKALGASVTVLVISLIKEFATWVVIATLLAWPASYFLASSWLSTFAHHIPMHPLWFLAASVSLFVFAVLTVSFQAFNAASRSPVSALQYE